MIHVSNIQLGQEFSGWAAERAEAQLGRPPFAPVPALVQMASDRSANAFGRRRSLLLCGAGLVLGACSNLGSARPPTGDQQRSYRHEAAGIESPYRLYVPSRWDGKQQLPLVVLLHGHSGDHNSPFDQTPPASKGIVQQLAEEFGYIVVSPMGMRRIEFGNELPMPFRQKFRGDPEPVGDAAAAYARNNRLAEADVLNVVRIVSQKYGTDPRRTYLMGNSGGSMGTLWLAARHPALWAAISPSDGPVEPTLFPFEKVKGLRGARVLHGEMDTTASFDEMRELADGLRSQGVETEFLIIPGGDHGSGWYAGLRDTFSFFARHAQR